MSMYQLLQDRQKEKNIPCLHSGELTIILCSQVHLICSTFSDPTKIYSQSLQDFRYDSFLQAVSMEIKLAAIYPLPQRTVQSLR